MQIDLQHSDVDREGAMAKADLYKLANYSFKLFKKINDDDQLEAWVQAKITKAADYIASVYHYLEYEMEFSEYGRKIEDSEIYSESQKKQMANLLNEAKSKLKDLKKVQAEKISKDKVLKDSIEPTGQAGEYAVKGDFTKAKAYDVDSIRLPKHGKIFWVNDHGSNMIVTKKPDGSIVVHSVGTHQQISDKWQKLKSKAEGHADLAESLTNTVVKIIEAAPSDGMSKKQKSNLVKKAKAGKDIGKLGKGFKAVEKAAKKSGATDPKAVAAAAMWKQAKKKAIKETTEEYHVPQVEHPDDDDLDESGLNLFGHGEEGWAETSQQMAQLLKYREQYRGTEYEDQIEQRIKALKDRLDLGKGEVLDASGNPKEVVPPEQFNSAQLNESADLTQIKILSGIK